MKFQVKENRFLLIEYTLKNILLRIYVYRSNVLNLFELTFDFQVCLAGEVIALSDDTSVPATVTDLGVLDGKGKEIFVSLDCKLSASVALLKTHRAVLIRYTHDFMPLESVIFIKKKK